ncbi:signal transduction histidine kinase [Bradyrhizobium sp. JR7.2]|jgi:signal transduction histidine kinase|uniref:histidine kinase n=1 Tax=Bradyrhizobium barranii TaxID=2992140 RepID=A0ABY3QMC2_9BRAD|nr:MULTISPECIES: GAF domain-containing sensor histidine kinase [Bradyrhizobium]UFW87156.1 GAF domain-containing sensor histidine kinase [Bradyrhizobium japonicum]WFT95669.1 GAF domain-containing sensor histidine kinase [Bradyrhizobium barranii]
MAIDIKADVDAVQQIGAVPKVLDLAARITGMGFVAIARVTSDQWICCAVRDSIAFGLEPGGELRVETTICNEIRQHGNTVVINDVQTDSDFCNHPTPAMYGFRSYISAPIVLIDGAVWGTLCAIDPTPRQLRTPEILDTFQLLAELIAAQLELNQRLERSQADLIDERKTAELREQFIGVLGHDLRNPLAAVDAGMRVLLKNLDTGRAPEIALGVQKAVYRMAGIVENVMDFARGRLGGGLTIKRDATLPLAPVLEQIIAEFRTAWPTVTISSSVQIEEPISCDRSKMGQLFSNLLGNAITYGDQSRPIHVVARTLDGTFDLTVSNEGPPISEKALANLFKPYTRGDRPSQQGLGLGLYIASQIAQAHGGKLSAISTGRETTFSFEMPI